MRFLVVLMLTCSGILAQSNWSDYFADLRDWHGDTATFSVQNGLQLDDSVANQIAIFRFSSAVDSATWRFSISYDFMPSSTNHASFYLMSDSPDLWGTSNGYFVRVGGGAQRTIALIRRTGNANNIILESTNQFLATSQVNVEVEVHRSSSGQWAVRVDTSSSGNQWINIGTVRDTTHNTSYFSGFFCRYTVTRANKIGFGFVEVTATSDEDVKPPLVISKQVENPLSVIVYFDRAVDIDSANVTIDGQICLVFYDVYSPTEILILPPVPLEENVLLEFVLEKVKSRSGVALTVFTSFLVNRKADYNDIVINELMVNPTPGVATLPEVSYIELYNASALPVPLADWQLQLNQSHRTLPNVEMQPGDYLLLVRDGDEDLFPSTIEVIGISMASNALTNSAGEVYLYDNHNKLVDALKYSDSWYRDQVKRGGGWSLERIDAYKSCGAINWRASESENGGTPGTTNSIASDLEVTVKTKITHWGLSEEGVLEVYFNIDLVSKDAEWYFNGEILPVEDVIGNRVRFRLSALPAPGEVYFLEHKGGVEDCAGRSISDTVLKIVVPDKPEIGDLLINEILPAPFSGGVSFIEIVNASGKYIDVNGLNMGRWLDEQAFDIRRVVHASRVLEPDGVLAFTPSVETTTRMYNHHNQDALIEVALPQMPNESGGVSLLSPSVGLLDAMYYDADMHSPFVRDSRGVSLQRLSLVRSSNQATNWTSTSGQMGWATPGVINSRKMSDEKGVSFSLYPEVLRLSDSGTDQLLCINYILDQSGGVGSLQIFTADGQHVSTPINNELLQLSGVLHWNGNIDSGFVAPSGLYVAVLEVVWPNGERKLFKDAFAVVY